MTINELKQKFIDIFGGSDENLRIFAAPGRVNLIGEHTDYNGGFVFPAALSMKTTIIARKRNDNYICLAATDLPDRVKIDPCKIDSYKTLKWGNYQAGIISEMMKNGYSIVGCDMLFDDTTPHGAGLSSSAAIEVATALALVTFSNEQNGIKDEIDMIEIAKIGQKAENNYVGVNCGIMDQFASAMGKKNKAIFLDCKDLSYRLVPLKIDGYKIVIANTNKKRNLADSKYNQRRAECEKGLELLKKAMPEKNFLGEITVNEYLKHKDLINNETIKKRIKHVIYECDRVLQSADALEKDDIKKFGELMIASHNSLRDLYEVTGVELDTLVKLALEVEGVIGARMTGAGFGGCSVNIVADYAVSNFIEYCGKHYEEKIGYAPSFYISEIGDGGMELKI